MMGTRQKEKIMQTLTSWEEKGIEKGKESERRSLALKMLQENISLDTIARITEFSISELKDLANG
jgi:predicted transposase/invertase (TIGR01784 family)